ncbi:hypothetical protein [Candidatus Accumulibacter sp. ACC012]|uniref:hypothetical protein n=1 Tax=Candidatus Accumulibacter sp. ACC012 TaxID=2823332 RepID=UPI0025BC39CA|nr:hypothetical protein [Candidatus Accumulibacter sp. ACC012]
MALATLTIDIIAKLANIERDLGRVSGLAERSAKRMESAFAGASSVIANAFAGLAGAFSVGAMAAMVTSSIDAADALSKLSQRTGETVENLARLQYAGSLADVSNDALATSLKKLSKNMAEAASGTGEVADAFRAIGVSVVASDGKLRSSGDVLNDVADRFAGYEDSAAKAALAQAIFGRSGADLIPLLNAGSQGLKEMGDEASKLGVVISTETAQAAERFNDQMTRVNAALGSIAKQTATELLPVLNELADSLVDIAKEGVDASRSFSPLSDAFRAFIVVGGNVAYVFKSIGTEIGGMAAQLVALARLDFKGFANIGEAMREDAEKSRKAIDAWSARVLSAGKSAGQTFDDYSNEGRGRELAEPAKSAAPKFNVPKIKSAGGGRAAKAIDDGQRLVDQLRDQIRATQNLTEVEKLEAAIADGKYRAASAANLEIARGYAETLDAIKAAKTAAEEEVDVQRQRLAVFAEGRRVFESVRTPVEALDAEVTHLVALLNAGAISMDTFGRAASRAGEGFIQMGEKAKETSNVMDEFAKSAATNIQSAFADFLFDPFKDGMSGMLKRFGETIQRMIAEAVAADLGKRLFGDLAKGGVGDGLLGGAFKLLSGLLPNADGGVYRSPSLSRFSGQIVNSPRLFAFAAGAGVMGEAGPEAILPLSRGSDGKLGVRGGSSTSVTVNIHGVTNAAELRRAGGQVGREVLAAISRAQRFA